MSTPSTIIDILALLRGHDITLWVEDGQLRYDAPRGALTPELRATLMAHKPALIAFLQRASAASGAAPAPIQPRADQLAPVPLSFAQQRLWLLDQLAPGSPAYVMAGSVRLSGPLHVQALELSLCEVLRRHQVLRTTFAVLDEHPLQQIGAPWPLGLVVDDLSQLPEAAREAAAERKIAELSGQPFDLARVPLLRVRLLRLAEHEHILMLCMHHIISDGWSMRVLIREIATLYPLFRRGESAALPILPVQYADYALWQRERLQGQALERLLHYWSAQLAGQLPVLELPLDYPRPAQRRSHGASQRVELPPALVAAVDVLARRAGCTPFMVLLAAFQVLLARWSGQSTVLVGTPIANRTQIEVEPLIGCFVNTLVLRADLAGNPHFADLLTQVRETTLGALAHQDLPFERLVEHVQPDRAAGHTPLFQVLFDLQDAPADELLLDDLHLQLLEIDPGVAKFDLSLALTRDGERLGGAFRYSTDLFAPATIERMAGHFVALLEQFVADPALPIGDAAMLAADERRRVLLEWNATAVEFPRDHCFHTLVEAQADRTPDAPAATLGDQRLSYAELDRRANQLAYLLRRRGVGPDVLVALCAELSFDLLVGLLGILKAGGAYVPLDPDYPRERMGLVLADTRAPVLVTQLALLERFPAHAAQVICLDADAAAISQEPDRRLCGVVMAQHLAYVLYTSGSTGTPKGTMIEHSSLLNYLQWVNSALIGETLRAIPAITKLSFDASLKQLLAPLLRGDAVWLLPAEQRQPARLIEELSRHRGVGLNCVPSLWRAMVEPILAGHVLFPENADFSLLLGGEHLGADLIAQSFAALPSLHMWNVYGPTETTANASTGLVQNGQDSTIGRPIANTQLYVLNARMQPQPVGVPGELYIGGVGVARGYLGRTDLTAERFVPNPFNDCRLQIADCRLGDDDPTIYNLQSTIYNSNRLYKTGDLARWLPDGTIEFLGRLDQQVKLRGYRIELGEIETALAQHPAVQQAVVSLHTTRSDDGRLVAYVVPTIEDRRLRIEDSHPGSSQDLSSICYPLSSELRAFLKERLPNYMVPSVFVLLEALPLMPNGKVDRRALPAPAEGASTAAITYVAPRTPVELALASVWAEILGLARVGIHDNFFELGGHSLLATQVLARVRKIYAVTPSLQALFEQPTVASLAEAVEASLRERGDQPASGPATSPIARRDPRARRLASQIDQISDAQARRLLNEKKSPHMGERSND